MIVLLRGFLVDCESDSWVGLIRPVLFVFVVKPFVVLEDPFGADDLLDPRELQTLLAAL